MYRENEDNCHTDSNYDCIQCIRGKKRTTLILIVIVTVFSVTDEKRGPLSYRFQFSLYSVLSDKKRRPLSYRFQFSLYSMYLVGNEDNFHTDSNSRCIQCIQWETGTTVMQIQISLFSVYPVGNEEHCHTDSNSHCIQCYSMRNEDHCHTGSNSECIQCYPITNEDHCHTDSNSHSTQCIRW